MLLEVVNGNVIGQFEYLPGVYSELLSKHQLLQTMNDEDKMIFDRRRDYFEGLVGPKYQKQQARRREKILRKRGKKE